MTRAYSLINPSILIGDLPLAEQLRQVAACGFAGVELWWPFAVPDPSAAEVDAVLETITASGLRLIGMNLYEGGMAEGNRGITCWPGMDREFDASLDVALRMQRETSFRSINVLHGTMSDAETADVQNDRAARRTARVADAFADAGVVATIEQLSHIPGYGLRTMDEVFAALDRARSYTTAGTVQIQIDLFHMFNMGDDVAEIFRARWQDIAHVQVADFPGRGAPGTGEQPIDDLLDVLYAQGYAREVALEYSHYEGTDPFAGVVVAAR